MAKLSTPRCNLVQRDKRTSARLSNTRPGRWRRRRAGLIAFVTLGFAETGRRLLRNHTTPKPEKKNFNKKKEEEEEEEKDQTWRRGQCTVDMNRTFMNFATVHVVHTRAK